MDDTFRMFNDWIMIEPIAAEETTRGGIVIPGTIDARTNHATVLFAPEDTEDKTFPEQGVEIIYDSLGGALEIEIKMPTPKKVTLIQLRQVICKV